MSRKVILNMDEQKKYDVIKRFVEGDPSFSFNTIII